jgi:hypothetical protein
VADEIDAHEVPRRSRVVIGTARAEAMATLARAGAAPILSTMPRVDLSWVTPELAVGGRFATADVPWLARLGVRGVVDLRREEHDDAALLAEHGIAFFELPTPDTRAPAQPLLDEGVAWLNARLDAGGRVLVHCQHGVGRSALLATCVLVSRGRSPPAAVAALKRARPAASPNREQLTALVNWSARWRDQHASPWRVPSVDELTAIAWQAATF